jgi:hypothetical protein
MFHHIWRLSEPGGGDLGLACNGDGLVLGRTPLVERCGGRFVVRDQNEIGRLLRRAYGRDIAPERIMGGLATVAAALNASDRALACIAAVHLRIPDLPNETARNALEAEDAFIRSANRTSALHYCENQKASPNDPKHPGWPAGTPGGIGGQFRPKNSSDIAVTEAIKGVVARHELRMSLNAVLHIGLDALANLVPAVDVAADVELLIEVAKTVSEYRKLAIDAAAALDFVKKGPRSLQELLVSSSEYEEFSSYDQFLKIQPDPELISKWFGSAGAGYQYHHIVTQGGANESKIPQNQLQSTDNIILLPTLLHEIVSAEYSRFIKDKGMTEYQWLQTQPYGVQREEGLRILRNLHILN